MGRRSGRYRECLAQVDRERTYAVDEAVAIVKSMRPAKFDETVELSVELGIDPRQSDQQVRASISLPHGIGKTLRVAVFAEGQKAQDARGAGADYVGSDELIGRVEQGWADFDVALAVPEMMSRIARLGRYLGPKGLMPSPKSGTVAQDIGEAVREFKAGKIEIRNDAGGNIHAPVGRLSFSEQALTENVQYLLQRLLKLKPPAAKGRYMKKAVLSSAMSPGIQIAS